jgi:hypothetical protein
MGSSYEKAFNLGPVGRPGDALTPHNTRHDENFRQLHGATYRQVFDLADWDRGWPPAPPANPASPAARTTATCCPCGPRGNIFRWLFPAPRWKK